MIVSQPQPLTVIPPTTKSTTPALIPSHVFCHDPKAGLNPLADAATYLFSILHQLKAADQLTDLEHLQTELAGAVQQFQQRLENQRYATEYVMIARYILCATVDEALGEMTWGAQENWSNYNLLQYYNQDIQHESKFFTILERSLQEPARYIDLLELIYLAINSGYKGQYRVTEHNQFKLNQITDRVYKQIRAERGKISKTLSPHTLKPIKTLVAPIEKKSSLLFICLFTFSAMMVIFICLSYLMDYTADEVYQTLATPKVIQIER